MSTVAQDQPLAAAEGGSLLQPFMPGAGWFEPQHAGVDVALPAYAPVQLLQAGNYQRAISSPYKSVFKLPSGGYEDYLHLTGAVEYQDGQLVPAGSNIGQVAPGTASGLMVPEYGGNLGGPYTSTTPHLHIAEYGADSYAQAAYDQASGAIDPVALLSSPSSPAAGSSGAAPAAGSTPFPESPVQQWLTDNVPGLGWLTGTTPSAGAPTGSNPPVLGSSAPGNYNSGSTLGVTPATPILGGIGGLITGGASPDASNGLRLSLPGLPSIPADFGLRVAAVAIGLALLVAGALIVSRGGVLKAVA